MSHGIHICIESGVLWERFRPRIYSNAWAWSYFGIPGAWGGQLKAPTMVHITSYGWIWWIGSTALESRCWCRPFAFMFLFCVSVCFWLVVLFFAFFGSRIRAWRSSWGKCELICRTFVSDAYQTFVLSQNHVCAKHGWARTQGLLIGLRRFSNLVGVHVPEHALLQNHAWAEA